MFNEPATSSQPVKKRKLHSSKNNGIKMSTLIFAVCFSVVVAFIAGTRSDQIYGTLAPVFGIKVANNGEVNTDLLNTVYKNLLNNYDGDLKPSDLSDGALHGLVSATGDPYTVYMNKQEAEDFNKELEGQISGVGCEIGVRADQPTVLRLVDGSPAQKSGLQVGDVFVKVNSTDVSGKDASTVAKLVRGDVGTTVKITVKRGEATHEYTITRDNVEDPSVRYSVKDGIGIIVISRFDGQTKQLAVKASEDLKSQNVKGVIVDLRDNGGGYLDSAQGIAGIWLDNKLVVTEKSKGQIVDSVKSGNKPILSGVKTVVLVNGGSASASEILAGALHDYKVATLVGEKTYGKGTVQKVMDLPSGGLLKVTVARWYTPNDVNISASGIKPDIESKLSLEQMNKGEDTQLATAMGLFN